MPWQGTYQGESVNRVAEDEDTRPTVSILPLCNRVSVGRGPWHVRPLLRSEALGGCSERVNDSWCPPPHRRLGLPEARNSRLRASRARACNWSVRFSVRINSCAVAIDQRRRRRFSLLIIVQMPARLGDDRTRRYRVCGQ
jgi:hypothetical protein